jgi:GT2 family glycosyltransferase
MDVELRPPIEDIQGLDAYKAVKALIRLHGVPIGYVNVPLHQGRCTAANLSRAILKEHGRIIIRHLVRKGLSAPVPPRGLRIADLVNMDAPAYEGSLPPVTVAVCTRDHTADLRICLEALSRLDYPQLDILVVDNAPKTDSTERVVRMHYPKVRYVREPRPGLNWARNRAIIETRGEIIAYTDDDVVVDPGWVRSFARVFAEDPAVMAVTGLVAPYELETEAQILFELYGGFGRGFKRRWYRRNHTGGQPQICHFGAGAFGTGANMAFRLSLFNEVGGFDPALDVGTVTNGGGDLEMFFRVLEEGHTLVYEPSAIVRHRHRREYGQLRSQLYHNGIGLYSYFTRSALAYPTQRLSFIRFGIWWLWRWHIRRLLINLTNPTRFPRDLILAELRGSLLGLFRYQKARRDAAKIRQTGDQIKRRKTHTGRAAQSVTSQGSTAVRMVDLGHPLRTLTGLQDYTTVRIFVTLDGCPLGSVDIPNLGQEICVTRLRDAIVDGLDLKLLEPNRKMVKNALREKILAGLTQYYAPTEDRPPRLAADVSASIVVATLDRPHDLRDCLRCLVAQKTPRSVEIVVVDNNPDSRLTPPVVSQFHDVVLVSEPRKGSSYARNKGITTSTGDIVITVDDDVTMPPSWLENLVAPFARSAAMAVTGNVLPFEMKTHAQQLFEAYGGLGRGFQPLEVNGDWFEGFKYSAVPTWKLGGTANAAFRAAIFRNAETGLLDEALGPGTPSGVGEDTYLFYKILKAGYTIVYEPAAYIFHKHRRDMRGLRRQIYDYSKGHVAYHLTTLLRDHDLRAVSRLLVGLPKAHLWRIKERLCGRSIYSVWLILLEVVGNLVGPFALWKSRRRVKREGRSDLYIPVADRSPPVKNPRLFEAAQ